MFERAIHFSALPVRLGTRSALAQRRSKQPPVQGEPHRPRARCSDEAPCRAHRGPAARAMGAIGETIANLMEKVMHTRKSTHSGPTSVRQPQVGSISLFLAWIE